MPDLPRFEGFRYELEGWGEFVYSPASDSIHVFDDHPEYTHVTYWDAERRQMTFQWLGELTLNHLQELGLPLTLRESITTVEFEAFEEWQEERRIAEEADEELEQGLAEIRSLDFVPDEWGDTSGPTLESGST